MDQNEFIKKLSEYAQLKLNRPSRQSGERVPEEPAEIQRNGQKFVIDYKNNPTVGLAIKKMLPISRPCDDCGRLVENRRIDIKKYVYPKEHWREHCLSCKMSRNPNTGEFDVATNKSFKEYEIWFKSLNQAEIEPTEINKNVDRS